MTALSLGKVAAAKKAAEVIADRLAETRTLGIGTGSTVGLVVKYLAGSAESLRYLREKRLYVSSLDTFFLLKGFGLEPQLFIPGDGVDLYFDGADEVVIDDNECVVLKGRGAALTREKILAYNSREVLIVVDESKLASRIGGLGKPLPIEVLPVASEPILRFLRSRGVRAEIRAGCRCRDGPAISDNNGFIIDAWPWALDDPRELIRSLKAIPGVIEHGFFEGLVDMVIVGYGDGEARLYECARTVKNPIVETASRS